MGSPEEDISSVPLGASYGEKTIRNPSTGSGGQYDTDSEKATPASAKPLPELQRRLKSRHLQMIAIGGTIGTGLFIGSGGSLAQAGPASALIAYAFVGTIVYSIICSLGEMATYLPISGAFTAYANRFVDNSLGFSMGWLYWFSWSITFPLELTATGIIINYWNDSVNQGIFIAVSWALILGTNLLPVSCYGEIEFWFSLIKCITVVGFMIFGICINAGVGKEGYIGFKYWHDPGAFAPFKTDIIGEDRLGLCKFVGFWAVLVQAGFSYQGTELVGIAAGETKDPRKSVPSAIKKTFYRIIFLFVLTVFFIGILIPHNEPQLLSPAQDASASPMVIAAKRAGVTVLPDFINAVLLTVVLSAANSNVYSGSRVLVGLAHDRCAPLIFQYTNRFGVPVFAVIFTSLMGLLGFLNLSSGGTRAFNWLQNISSIAGFTSWMGIQVCHLCFMRALKARNISRDTLPYKAPFQPYFTYYGLVSCVIIVLTQGFQAFMPWDTSAFFAAYISLIIWVVLYVGHKLIMRPPYVKPGEADIDTGRLPDALSDSWATGEASRPNGWKERIKHRASAIFL
ncbi:hypothetical protein KEM54_005197 [Ascosphaera aggregata]|nr:hypothetical protein KEM54_005197 [Ascosphaera aggregata]